MLADINDPHPTSPLPVPATPVDSPVSDFARDLYAAAGMNSPEMRPFQSPTELPELTFVSGAPVFEPSYLSEFARDVYTASDPSLVCT